MLKEIIVGTTMLVMLAPALQIPAKAQAAAEGEAFKAYYSSSKNCIRSTASPADARGLSSGWSYECVAQDGVLFIKSKSNKCPAIAIAQIPRNNSAGKIKDTLCAFLAADVKTNPIAEIPKSTEKTLDRFGLPSLDPKRYLKQNPDDTTSYDVYLDMSSPRKLKNKGAYGRYIEYKNLFREIKAPTPATAGYQVEISPGKTSCYGSAYGSYGSAYGSSNCTTSAPTYMNVPGSPESPGGPRETMITVYWDCVDNTMQIEKRGGWKKYNYADPLCKLIDGFPEGDEI